MIMKHNDVWCIWCYSIMWYVHVLWFLFSFLMECRHFYMSWNWSVSVPLDTVSVVKLVNLFSTSAQDNPDIDEYFKIIQILQGCFKTKLLSVYVLGIVLCLFRLCIGDGIFWEDKITGTIDCFYYFILVPPFFPLTFWGTNMVTPCLWWLTAIWKNRRLSGGKWRRYLLEHQAIPTAPPPSLFVSLSPSLHPSFFHSLTQSLPWLFCLLLLYVCLHVASDNVLVFSLSELFGWGKPARLLTFASISIDCVLYVWVCVDRNENCRKNINKIYLKKWTKTTAN